MKERRSQVSPASVFFHSARLDYELSFEMWSDPNTLLRCLTIAARSLMKSNDEIGNRRRWFDIRTLFFFSPAKYQNVRCTVYIYWPSASIAIRILAFVSLSTHLSTNGGGAEIESPAFAVWGFRSEATNE